MTEHRPWPALGTSTPAARQAIVDAQETHRLALTEFSKATLTAVTILAKGDSEQFQTMLFLMANFWKQNAHLNEPGNKLEVRLGTTEIDIDPSSAMNACCSTARIPRPREQQEGTSTHTSRRRTGSTSPFTQRTLQIMDDVLGNDLEKRREWLSTISDVLRTYDRMHSGGKGPRIRLSIEGIYGDRELLTPSEGSTMLNDYAATMGQRSDRDL